MVFKLFQVEDELPADGIDCGVGVDEPRVGQADCAAWPLLAAIQMGGWGC